MDITKKEKEKELTKELIEKGIQTHHISYEPAITIDILIDLHKEFHGHGTGPPKKGFVEKTTKEITKSKMIKKPLLKRGTHVDFNVHPMLLTMLFVNGKAKIVGQNKDGKEIYEVDEKILEKTKEIWKQRK